jgi:hypothetical protein
MELSIAHGGAQLREHGTHCEYIIFPFNYRYGTLHKLMNIQFIE